MRGRDDIVYEDSDVLIYGSEVPTSAGSISYYGYTTVVKPDNSKLWTDNGIGWGDETTVIPLGNSGQVSRRQELSKYYLVDNLTQGDAYLITNVGTVRGEPIDLKVTFNTVGRIADPEASRRYYSSLLSNELASDQRRHQSLRGPEDLMIGPSSAGGTDIEFYLRNIPRTDTTVTYLNKKG